MRVICSHSKPLFTVEGNAIEQVQCFRKALPRLVPFLHGCIAISLLRPAHFLQEFGFDVLTGI